MQQGLTAISVEDAYQIIEGWQQQLQGNDISEDLGQLKQAIMNGDTPAIKKILTDLGEDTREAASGATDTNASSKVRQIGELLSQAANSLQ